MKMIPETAELIVTEEASSSEHTIVQSDVF
jgi:hypothetical protein